MNQTEFDLGFGLPITFQEPLARNSDPETSHEAAAFATFRSNKGREKALLTLYRHGPMTDYELAAATGLQQNSVGKRRGECAVAGLVAALYDGDQLVKRQTPSGSRAIVWELTSAGYTYARLHHG